VKASLNPTYKQAMMGIGVEAAASASPEEFASFVRSETVKWARVIQATGTRVD
jgi:tripartite-type tricarboxylate transporter receptor subunit TctC